MPSYSFPTGAGHPLASGEALGEEGLRTALRHLGLAESGLGLSVEDDRVVVTGRISDAEARERVVLALGNIKGVAHVEDRMETVEQPPLLDTLSSFARLPAGAASTDMAEEMVHEEKPGMTPVRGPAGSIFITARASDSLPALARRYYGDETAWPRILEANRDALLVPEAPDSLQPGLVLRLPPR